MPRACITQEQADEFAIGAMTPEEEARIGAHIRDCESCLDRVAAAQRVAATLAFGLPRAHPSRGLRHRVMLRAGIVRQGQAARAMRWVRAAGGVAAVIVAVAAFTGMVTVRSQVAGLRDDNDDVQNQIDDALSQKVEILALTQGLADEQKRSEELEQAARGDRELLLAMLSPESQVADVVSREEGAASIGRLVWDEDQKKVWFVASRLRPLPQGETYQVWVNSGGRFHSLGTFNADADGYARYVAVVPQGLQGYESAVVTIERTGTSERTGDSVFVADLSRFRR